MFTSDVPILIVDSKILSIPIVNTLFFAISVSIPNAWKRSKCLEKVNISERLLEDANVYSPKGFAVQSWKSFKYLQNVVLFFFLQSCVIVICTIVPNEIISFSGIKICCSYKFKFCFSCSARPTTS